MKDQEEERAAILAVIEAETEAYLRRDYEAWEKCWHDGPEIRRLQVHIGSGVTLVEGAEIRKLMRRVMTHYPDPEPIDAIRREKLNVVISPQMAWVSYEQTGDTSGALIEMGGRCHELKILHKVEGQWKIACIVGTQIRVDHIIAPVIEVNVEGQLIWMNEAARERLPGHPKLGQRGNRLQATDTEAQEKLLEAILWMAEVRDRHTICAGEDAISRAIALGQDDTGFAHICWATLQDGKLLITFDDADKLDRQLAGASEVYGLSKAQEKLSRFLVEGCDLSSAARALGISPNTAKTHLQRIYDKTGVRAQSALVRLLLNADRRSV